VLYTGNRKPYQPLAARAPQQPSDLEKEFML